MGETTKIQWCHHTFNPWRGCAKVSPECQFCYADAQSKRNPGVLGVWGPNGTRVVAAESAWREPVKWNREAEKAGERRRVFCASLADIFEDWQGPMVDAKGKPLMIASGAAFPFDGPGEYRNVTMDDVRRRLFQLIDETPWLNWLLLTKRPENIRRMWPTNPHWTIGAGVRGSELVFRSNVWLLTSAGTQETADKFIPHLRDCRDLVPVLGVSAEPLLGPVDFRNLENGTLDCLDGSRKTRAGEVYAGGLGIDWVIVGGESGPHARPCDLAWIRSIRDQCHDAGVPLFVKQLGSRAEEWDAIRREPHAGPYISNSIRDTKGGDPEEWPDELRIREFPGVYQAGGTL